MYTISFLTLENLVRSGKCLFGGTKAGDRTNCDFGFPGCACVDMIAVYHVKKAIEDA